MLDVYVTDCEYTKPAQRVAPPRERVHCLTRLAEGRSSTRRVKWSLLFFYVPCSTLVYTDGKNRWHVICTMKTTFLIDILYYNQWPRSAAIAMLENLFIR